MQNHITGKRWVISYNVWVLFDSKMKHFPVFPRLLKIYIADQKPHTMELFFHIYTKMCHRKRGHNDTQTRSL